MSYDYFTSTRTWAKANQLYAAIVPIKGTNERRLGYRYNQRCVIEETPNGEYVVKLYGSPIITYRSNGLVEVNLCGWDTMLTRNVLNLMGYETHRTGNQTYFIAYNQRVGEYRYYAFENKQPLILREGNGDTYKSGAKQTYKNLLNKKRGELALEAWKPLLVYAKALSLLNDGLIVRDLPINKRKRNAKPDMTVAPTEEKMHQFIIDYVLSKRAKFGARTISYSYISFTRSLRNDVYQTNNCYDSTPITIGQLV